MKLSEHWLRELVDPGLPTAKLADLLTFGGIEVEAAGVGPEEAHGGLDVLEGHLADFLRPLLDLVDRAADHQAEAVAARERRLVIALVNVIRDVNALGALEFGLGGAQLVGALERQMDRRGERLGLVG